MGRGGGCMGPFAAFTSSIRSRAFLPFPAGRASVVATPLPTSGASLRGGAPAEGVATRESGREIEFPRAPGFGARGAGDDGGAAPAPRRRSEIMTADSTAAAPIEGGAPAREGSRRRGAPRAPETPPEGR